MIQNCTLYYYMYIMFYLESIENNKKYLKKRNFVLRFRLQSPPA